MAKKKPTHQPNPTSELEPQLSHHTHSAAAAAVSSEKLANLKSLNSLLLKETHNRRQQVEALVKANNALQADVSKLGDDNRALMSELDEKSAENFCFDVEKSVFGAVATAQMGEAARIKDKEVEGLTREVENAEEKLRRVCWERDLVKGDFDGLAVEANGLRLRVVEMEEKERRAVEEIESVRLEYRGLMDAVTREKGVAGRKVAELEGLVEELKREIGVIRKEKSEVEKGRSGQEVMVTCLEKEVGELKEVGLRLREEKEELTKKVSELVESVGEAAAREREMGKKVKVLMNEKKENEDKVERLSEEVKSQKEILDMVTEELRNKEERLKEVIQEKKEMEDSVERLNEEVKSEKAILDVVTEELRNKEERLKEVIQEKNEIEVAKENQEGEVGRLSKIEGEQRDTIFSLRKTCHEQEEENARLVSEVHQYKDDVEGIKQERAEARKSLAVQEKIVEELKLIVSEREEKVKEIEQLLEKLRSDIDNISEKNKVIEGCLESLEKEKDIMRESLSVAQREIDDRKVKYESAGRSSKQALTMLKNTAAFLSSQSEGKKGVSIKEKHLGEEIQPYAAELDAIQNAFRNNEKMVEDLTLQLESMHAVAQAQKRKSFWTLLSSATFIATASVAYATKGR